MKRAIEAMGRAIEGSGKPFVGTSGTMLLAAATPGRVGTEQDAAEQGPQIDSENTVIALASRAPPANCAGPVPATASAARGSDARVA